MPVPETIPGVTFSNTPPTAETVAGVTFSNTAPTGETIAGVTFTATAPTGETIAGVTFNNTAPVAEAPGADKLVVDFAVSPFYTLSGGVLTALANTYGGITVEHLLGSANRWGLTPSSNGTSTVAGKFVAYEVGVAAPSQFFYVDHPDVAPVGWYRASDLVLADDAEIDTTRSGGLVAPAGDTSVRTLTFNRF